MGDAAEAGLETEAHDYFLRVGWRRARAAGLDRMGGNARGRTAQNAAVYINSD